MASSKIKNEKVVINGKRFYIGYNSQYNLLALEVEADDGTLYSLHFVKSGGIVFYENGTSLWTNR